MQRIPSKSRKSNDLSKTSGSSPTQKQSNHSSRSPFAPPHWHGEPRPRGARRVRIQTRFPSIGYLTYLVRDLGYDGNAALAAMVQAHQPWLRSVDRSRASVNAQTEYEGTLEADFFAGYQDDSWRKSGRSPLVSVVRPYIPAVPSRRLNGGGGLTEEQVQRALVKKRWDARMKKAIFEIVYRRRSCLQVSNESGIPVEILYVYASRLRQDIRKAGLCGQRKAA
jgi:hypothetical protein